ncbi:hypothetical protein O3P69_018645 [Scylla paramamosain]|uniref:Uncharacterized protein n=1 Tax=Scylla paramamosain TaxID=85552 RepID=A0AAW0T349_SCYPA
MGHDYHCVLVQACCLAGSACEGQQLVRRARETQNIGWDPSRDLPKLEFVVEGQLLMGKLGDLLEEQEEPDHWLLTGCDINTLHVWYVQELAEGQGDRAHSLTIPAHHAPDKSVTWVHAQAPLLSFSAEDHSWHPCEIAGRANLQ